MTKDLLVLADEYAAATATFARALALKDSADSMSPIAREAGDKRAVLAEALAALDTAQPERAPLSDAELEQEFCKITGLETGINPAAADTKRALVWFKKGYAHAIKQGAQQAQPERGSSDADCDRAYRNGLKAGFSFGLEGNEEGFRKSMESYQREIAAHGIKQGGQP